MRDAHRLREKVELSLDDRQVAVLAVCALLLFGGVFTLGVMVGKRLSAAAPPALATDDLAALDEQQAQRRPSARAPLMAARPSAPRTGEAQAALASGDKAAPETPAPMDLPGASRTRQSAPAQPIERDDQALADPSPGAADAVVAPAPKAPLVVDPLPPPAKIRPTTSVMVDGTPRDPGRFTVQVGASQDKTDAQRLEARARAAGLKPYLVEARVGGATWYRVRVGAFADKDSANRYRKDVERELRTSATVMPSR